MLNQNGLQSPETRSHAVSFPDPSLPLSSAFALLSLGLTSTNFTIPKLQKASQSSFKDTNQKKDMLISDLLVMARLERVAFGLYIN